MEQDFHELRGLKNGQTILELLVVLTLTTLLTSMVITFNRTANNQNQLFQFTDKFLLDIRQVQDLAYLSQEYNGPEESYRGQIPCGYGIAFDQNSGKSYLIFAAFSADCNQLGTSNYTRAKIEQVNLPPLIKITQVSSNPVIFVPPYPRSIFFPPAESMTIRLALQGSENNVFREITINKAGQITQKVSNQ